MELRDIEYFAVIAQHGHLGRAAEALRLTQPALSKSLRRLEEAVEAKLVKRTPKGVELTAEGAALLNRAKGLRLSLQDVAREVKDVSEGRVGHLRVGVGESIAEYLLPAAFDQLLRGAPKVSLRIEVSDNDVMVPMLQNGELDLVVNFLAYFLMPSLPEGIAHEKLYEDDMVVFAAPGHPLTKQKRVTLADLSAARWALTERVLQPYRLLERAFHEHGLPSPRTAMESRSSRIRFASIACSDLLGFGSVLGFRHVGARYKLKEIPVKELERRRTVGVMYRQGAYLSPAARRLIGILRSSAPSLK